MFSVYCYSDLPDDGRVQRTINALLELGFVYSISITNKGDAPRNNQAYTINRRSYFLFLVRSLFHLVSRPKGVHYFHDYYCLPLIIVASTLKIKCIYDMHEFSPCKNMSFRKKFFVALERMSLRKGVVCIYPEHHRAKLARRFYKSYNSPYTIIRNISELATEELGNKKSVSKSELNVRVSSLSLVYQGVISRSRALGHIIKLVSEARDIKLTIIGNGPDLIFLKELTEELNACDKICFLGHVQREELYELLRNFDGGIVTYDMSNPNNRWPAPNKIYEYAQCGLPIICSNQTPLRKIITSNNIGLSVPLQNMSTIEFDKMVSNFRKEVAEFNECCYTFARTNSSLTEMDRFKRFIKMMSY